VIRACLTLAFILAAACFVGIVDRQSSEVSYRAAMEGPRPIFEPAHELKRLHMPCDYVTVGAYQEQHGQITAKNTRCVRADGRNE